MRYWIAAVIAVTACLAFGSCRAALKASSSNNFDVKAGVGNIAPSQTHHYSHKNGTAVTFINTLHFTEEKKDKKNSNITIIINRKLVNHDPTFAKMVITEAVSEIKKPISNGNKIYAVSVIKDDKRTVIQTDIASDNQTEKHISIAKNQNASVITSKPNITQKKPNTVTEATTEKDMKYAFKLVAPTFASITTPKTAMNSTSFNTPVKSQQSPLLVHNQTARRNSSKLINLTSVDKITSRLNNTTHFKSKVLLKPNFKIETTAPFLNQTSNRKSESEINSSTITTTDPSNKIPHTTMSSAYKAQSYESKVVESDQARYVADAIRLKNDHASEIKGREHNLAVDRAWQIVAAIQNTEARLESSGVPRPLARKLALGMYEIPVIPGRGPLISP